MDLNKLDIPKSTFKINGKEYVYCIDQKSDVKTSLIKLIVPNTILENSIHTVITIFNCSSHSILINFGPNVSNKNYSIELRPHQSYQSTNNSFNGEITAVIKNEY